MISQSSGQVSRSIPLLLQLKLRTPLKQRPLSYSNIKHGCRQQEALQIIKQQPVSGTCFVLFSYEKTNQARLRVMQPTVTQLSTGFDRKHPQQRLPTVLNTAETEPWDTKEWKKGLVTG